MLLFEVLPIRCSHVQTLVLSVTLENFPCPITKLLCRRPKHINAAKRLPCSSHQLQLISAVGYFALNSKLLLDHLSLKTRQPSVFTLSNRTFWEQNDFSTLFPDRTFFSVKTVVGSLSSQPDGILFFSQMTSIFSAR